MVATVALLASGGTIALTAAPAAAAPTTWFVTTAGGGSACTNANPCGSITTALAKAAPGDTIEVAGTIRENVAIKQDVTISNWPGARAVIEGQSDHSSVVSINRSTVHLDHLTITGGVGAGGGGGVTVLSGNLTVTDSTITGNTVTDNGAGGGIAGIGSTLTIVDSTITGNTGPGGGGGVNDSGSVTITDSTIANNNGGAIGGGNYTVGGSIILTGAPNCAAGVTSVGYNLTDHPSTRCNFTQPTDVVVRDAQLGPLASNGGTTQTLLPGPNSPAVARIPSPTTLNGVPVCGPGATDQRGESRPMGSGARCTIGAVEVPVTTGVGSGPPGGGPPGVGAPGFSVWDPEQSGTTANLESVSFIDANHGWAVGNASTILTTSDGGASWTREGNPAGVDLASVSFVDANHGWAVGAGGVIVATSDGGRTWTRESSGTTDSLNGVSFADPTHGWAVGELGTIRATSDGGTTWSADVSGTTADLFSVAFEPHTTPGPYTGVAVGAGGTIVATPDGTNWFPPTSPTRSTLRSVVIGFNHATWAVGDNATIVAAPIDSGFGPQPSGNAAGLRGVAFDGLQRGFAVGDSGTTLITNNGGTVWAVEPSGTTVTLNGVSFVNGHAWAVGDGGTILKHEEPFGIGAPPPPPTTGGHHRPQRLRHRHGHHDQQHQGHGHHATRHRRRSR